MLMGANRFSKQQESKKDRKFPHEKCIDGSEMKTKGKLCLFGECVGGLAEKGCHIVIHLVFLLFINTGC